MSLRHRVVLAAGTAAVGFLALAAWGGDVGLARSMVGSTDERLIDAGRRSALLVDRVLAERRSQVELAASAPTVVDAARRGGVRSRELGLPQMTIEALESRFKATRSQQVDARALEYLDDLLPKLEIAEVMLTDSYGFNAVTTSPSADFVQSDEGWWQQAWATGWTDAEATEDAATQQTVVELAHAVLDGTTRVGVVKVKFGLATVDSTLMHAGMTNALQVDLVDSLGRVIASSGSGGRNRVLTGAVHLKASARDTVQPYIAEDGSRQLAMIASANGGEWRIVAHIDDHVALGPYRSARNALVAGIAVLLLAILAGLAAVSRFIDRRITGPAADLASLAEAVAAGDLSQQVGERQADDEIGRLGRAIGAMIDELRRLASALSASARDTSAMSAEITAGSEQMAASAGEIATTASDLSQQSSTMAQTIQALATAADDLVKLAGELDSGAHEGVERNAQLKALALENRSRLDESARALETLTGEVATGTNAIEQLATASIEVRTFVVLVQKLARQSKLLALNAAMEAARAGEQGEGFAVVASEVRRLAAMSSEAAERTQRIVNDVVTGIDRSRESSERMVSTLRVVRGATEHGSASFGDIENAVKGADGWTASIQHTAAVANALVNELRGRLGTLASGTDSFAAAMQEVAASSEEQSASTEEIAAASATLAAAAERLLSLVRNLRLDAPSSRPAPEPVAQPSIAAPGPGYVMHPASAAIA